MRRRDFRVHPRAIQDWNTCDTSPNSTDKGGRARRKKRQGEHLSEREKTAEAYKSHGATVLPSADEATDVAANNQSLAIQVHFFAALAASVNGSDSCNIPFANSKFQIVLDRGASFAYTTAEQRVSSLQKHSSLLRTATGAQTLTTHAGKIESEE